MTRVATSIAVFAISFAAAGTTLAQDDPAAASESQWAAEQAARAERQTELEALMATMAEEMHAIRATTNLDERAQLMEAHRESMREAMTLMSEMGGMYMHDMVAEHLGRGPASAEETDTPRHQHKRAPISRPRAGMSDAERLADLEARVDMMQIMIESIIEAQVQ